MRTERQPDWRNTETYAYTANLTRLGWAWEFLRRNPRFQADFRQSSDIGGAGRHGDLRRWGVLRADDPTKNGLDAKVFWDPDACAAVLPLVAGQNASPVDTRRVVKHGVSHVLLCDGGRRLQLSVQVCAQPMPDNLLTDAVVLPRERPHRWRSLICFNEFLFSGHLSRRHFRTERMARRLVSVVQALDGAMSDAPHRDIAIALHGRVRVSCDWNDPGEYLRDGVRRAIRRGRLLMNGGYRQFLR
jgi:hypothetical protein